MTKFLTLFVLLSYSSRILSSLENEPLTTIFKSLPKSDGFISSKYLKSPSSLVFDKNGTLYFSDDFTMRISSIRATRESIETFVGNGQKGFRPGFGENAALGKSWSIKMDSKGNMYALIDGQMIIKITDNSLVRLFAGVPGGSATVSDGPLLEAKFLVITGLIIDNEDNIFVCEGLFDGQGGNRVRKISNGTVKTIAGGRDVGYRDGPGTDALFNHVSAITFDLVGNILIFDKGNAAIRILNSTGYVSTLLKSNGIRTVDGHFRVAEFSLSTAIAIDQFGDIYFYDLKPSSIRKIDMQANTVSTIIGDGFAGFYDGSGLSAEINEVKDCIFDRKFENLYIADTRNSAIRVYNIKTKFVSTIARFEGVGFEDGFGGRAKFSNPMDTAFDDQNNLYVSDHENHAIRKISPDGTVSKYAGFDGVAGNKDSTLKDSLFYGPIGITFFKDNLYVMDYGNKVIRYISNNTVKTISGNGTDSSFERPNMATIDNQNGLLYLTDWLGQNIKRLNISNQFIETWAGIGYSTYNNGFRLNAGLCYPTGICINKNGVLYFTDQCNEIRKIDIDGMVSSVAGNVQAGYGYQDGTGKNAKFMFPNGLACSTTENIVYIAEAFLGTVRSVDAVTKIVKTVAGGQRFGNRNGLRLKAYFNNPQCVTIGNNGFLYVCDSGNNAIKKIDTRSGRVTSVAGYGASKYRLNATFVESLENPQGLAINPVTNIVYLADTENHMILRFEHGKMNIHAGLGSMGYYDNSSNLRDSEFYYPHALAFSKNGSRLIIADTWNHVIREILATGVITIAGTGEIGNINGPSLRAAFNSPKDVIFDSHGIIYVSDTVNNMIKTVSDTVSPLIGTFDPGFKNGKGLMSQLNQPIGLVFDKDETNLYIADSLNHAIRKYDMKSKLVSTIAGTGEPGFENGFNGTFKYPISLAIYENTIYVADRGNNAIRKVDLKTLFVSVLMRGTKEESQDVPVNSVKLNSPSNIAIDNTGNMFILDAGNNALRRFNLKIYYSTIPDDNSKNYSQMISYMALSISIILFVLALICFIIYRKTIPGNRETVNLIILKSNRSKKSTNEILNDLSARHFTSTEASKTVSISKSVAISLPGDLLVEDFDKLFELDLTKGNDSVMFGGTAAVTRGHIIDQTLIEKHGFRDIAIKVIRGDQSRDSMQFHSFKYEISIMTSLPSSPNIVKFKQSPTTGRIPKQPCTENEMLHRYCQGNGPDSCKNIVHFDLKPGNILVQINAISEYEFAICDFGFSAYTSEAERQLVAGMKKPSSAGITIRYAAPELFLKVYMGIEDPKTIKKVDVFAYGMTLYQIWTNTKPWDESSSEEITRNVLSNIRPEIPKTVDLGMRELIESCWQSNPVDRKSFSDILTNLIDLN